MRENQITTRRNVLVVLQEEINAETRYLTDHFCGEVVYHLPANGDNKRIYVCGNVAGIKEPVYIIKELSSNYEPAANLITLGEVPVIISKAGVYFRKLFTEEHYFDQIKSEHTFQELTESNKPGKAFRKGIYLTDITKDDNDTLHYRLLRCSSNFLIFQQKSSNLRNLI